MDFGVQLQMLVLVFCVSSTSCKYREAKRRYRKLLKDKNVILKYIGEMREKSDEMLTKKFGRKVSIVKLESIMINQELEHLKVDQLKFEDECTRGLAEWAVSLTHFGRSTKR